MIRYLFCKIPFLKGKKVYSLVTFMVKSHFDCQVTMQVEPIALAKDVRIGELIIPTN